MCAASRFSLLILLIRALIRSVGNAEVPLLVGALITEALPTYARISKRGKCGLSKAPKYLH